MTSPAPDRADGHGTTASLDDAFATLAHAIDQQLGGDTRHGELSEAARAYVTAAKRRGLRAEDVIINLKLLLNSLAPEQRLEAYTGRDRFRERLVTLCIEEYYRADPRGDPPATPRAD